VLLIALFAIVAVAQGLGHPSPSGEEVAIVEDAEDGGNVAITRAQFDAALEQTALRQGLPEVPAEDDPQYELLRDTAFSDLLLAVWVRGEGEDRGIEISREEVEEELEQIKEQQFDGRERRFQRFLEQSGFTEEEALERVELQLISDQIQTDVLPAEPEVTEREVEIYYESNRAQFEQPETRDVRVIETETEDEAQEARDRLDDDSRPRSWNQVASDLSTDEVTQDVGGLRQGVVEGQSEPALDEQAFAATEGELVGPFEGETGFFVLQVENIIPAQTFALEDARDQIEQAIAGQRQQEAAQAFQLEFVEKWRSRTFCAEGFRIERCANAEPRADVCPEEIAAEQGCPAPVPSTRPIEPGTAAPFGEPPGRPQGPKTPEPEQPELPEGLPPELEQIPEGPPPGE
jgi:foldase protein PrsA